MSEAAVRGGAERSSLLIAEALLERGLGCRLAFARPGVLAEEAALRGVPLLPGAGRYVPGRFRLRVPFILSAARSGRFDLVHVSALEQRCRWTAETALRAGVPVVAHLRSAWQVSAAHALHRQGAFVVTNSSATARQLTHLGDQRVRFVPNGLDAEAFLRSSGDLAIRGAEGNAARRALRRSLGVPDGAVMALVVANVAWYKGLDQLADGLGPALAAHPDLHVVHAGARVYRSESATERRFRAAIERTGFAERFHLLGLRRDVAALNLAADVVLVPSRGEGTARAILEGWAAGRAVVAADAEGLRDLVDDGRNGRLMPLDDPEVTGAVLTEVVADPDQRRRLAEQGRRDVRLRYSHRAHVDALLEVYGHLGVQGTGPLAGVPA